MSQSKISIVSTDDGIVVDISYDGARVVQASLDGDAIEAAAGHRKPAAS